MVGRRRDIEAGSAYVRLYMKQTAFDRGIRTLKRKLRNTGRAFTEVGRTATLAGTAMVAAIGMATKAYAEFDDQMRAVKAVASATAGEFQNLTKQAEDLGRTTSFTARQVAEAMLNLSRAGFNPAETEAAIPGVLNLARATGTELAEAAEIAAGTLRAFRLEADQMGRTTDVLTATANNSSQTLTDLGESMKDAAPIAQRYGLTLEETSKAIGVLANLQIKGSKSGVAIRQILLQLADPKIRADLAGMGVNLDDFGETLIGIGKVAQGMSGAEQLGFLKTFFGQRAAAAAATLATVSFPKLSAAIDNAGGTAKKTAEEMDSGLGGAMRRFMSAVEGVQIAIGKALEGPLREWGDSLAKTAVELAAWINANKSLVVTIASVAAGMTGLGAVMVTAGAALAAASVAVGGLTTALTFMAAHPLVFIVAGFAAATAAVVAFNRELQSSDSVLSQVRARGDEMRAGHLDMARELSVLAGQQSRTSEEMGRAAEIIDTLQDRYGELGLSIDDSTNSINGMAGAFEELFRIMREETLGRLRGEMQGLQSDLARLEKDRAKPKGGLRWTLAVTDEDLRRDQEKLDKLKAKQREINALAERIQGLEGRGNLALDRALSGRRSPGLTGGAGGPGPATVAGAAAAGGSEGPAGIKLQAFPSIAGGQDPLGIESQKHRMRQLKNEIRELEIRQNFKGVDRARQLLEMRKTEELRGAGTPEERAAIVRKYQLEWGATQQDFASRTRHAGAVGPFGTFSTAAALAMSGGVSSPQERMAKGIERMVDKFGDLLGLTETEVELLRDSLNYT